MIVKNIVDEDFVNYKKPCMFIIFPKCSFKCDKECGTQVCQNSSVASLPNIEMSKQKIVKRYLNNPITNSIVFGGLEPFDSPFDLLGLIDEFRKNTQDDIVVYSGYNKEEIIDQINNLKTFPNIIVKFGRYIPNSSKHMDEVLGVELASSNQYAEKIS